MLFQDDTRTDFSLIKLSDCRVMDAARREVESFIEKNHYSGSINGVTSDYCFALRYGNDTIGACIYGRMAMAGQYKRFGEAEDEVIELRRLCCVDLTPKNTESYFISRTIRWLIANTKHKIIVSYADEEHGHSGVIYRASNFAYVGFSKGARVIEYEGSHYHDKTIRTTYNGKLKPFAARIKEALADGLAQYKDTAGKHCFVYDIEGKRPKKKQKAHGEVSQLPPSIQESPE